MAVETGQDVAEWVERVERRFQEICPQRRKIRKTELRQEIALEYQMIS